MIISKLTSHNRAPGPGIHESLLQLIIQRFLLICSFGNRKQRFDNGPVALFLQLYAEQDIFNKINAKKQIYKRH